MENNLIQKLVDKFGSEMVNKWSIVQKPDWTAFMINFLQENGPFNTILEIGTFRGVSSIILSSFCKKLITVDVRKQPETKFFWDYLNITNIESHILPDKEVRNFVSKLNFDLAFIDGNHSYPNPRKDFEAVKKCGLVLFHDYFEDKRFSGINEIVNSLSDTQINEPFAIWRKL